MTKIKKFIKKHRKKTYYSKPAKLSKDEAWLGIERKKQVKTNTKVFRISEIIELKNNNYIVTSKNKYTLCGLKNFLDGKMYDDDVNELNEIFKERIRNYKIEAITINEKEDANFNFIDMFIRLNQNPCPIFLQHIFFLKIKTNKMNIMKLNFQLLIKTKLLIF